MKWRTLAMTAAVAVLAALSAPVAAQAGTGVPAASAVTPHKSPAASTPRCTSAQSGTGERCVQVKQIPLSKLTPAQRTERATMIRGRLRTTNTPRVNATSTGTAIVAPTQCNFVPAYDDSAFTANPDRFTSCADTFWEIWQYETTDGVTSIVGTFYFEDLQWASYSATSSTWAHGMITLGYLEGATGTMEDGFSGLLSSNCTSGGAGVCTATSLTSPDPQTVAIAPSSVSYFEWAESDAGPASTTANSETFLDFTLGVVWTITSPVPILVDDVPYAAEGSPTTGLAGRCDTIATSTDGCVNEDFTPTLTYDSTAYPLVAPVAQHIYTAQTATPANGGLITKWGVPSSGVPLYRDMNQADISANRTAACGSITVPPGDSCDEYPLASTYEGAAFNSDYSTAIVPSSANSSQGGLTSGFYTGDRVLDNDPFYVLAILPNGTASW